MTKSERMHEVNGVELCAWAEGDPADPAILLLHGAGHSLVAWPDAFVARLVEGGRYVIRFDSRDAGRSTGYAPGEPRYSLRDLVADAVGLLDSYGLDKAHLLGMSQGAAVAQLVAIEHPGRVASLTLASSTPGGPGHEAPDLPEMAPEIAALFAGEEAAEPDWDDRAAVIEYLVEAERPFAGAFDEEATRLAAARMVDHAAGIAGQLTNPYMIDAGDPWRTRLKEIAVPALVLHGTDDPLFPVGHGRVLADEIPGARFVEMACTGHEVFPRAQWDTVVPAVLELTSAT